MASVLHYRSLVDNTSKPQIIGYTSQDPELVLDWVFSRFHVSDYQGIKIPTLPNVPLPKSSLIIAHIPSAQGLTGDIRNIEYSGPMHATKRTNKIFAPEEKEIADLLKQQIEPNNYEQAPLDEIKALHYAQIFAVLKQPLTVEKIIQMSTHPKYDATAWLTQG